MNLKKGKILAHAVPLILGIAAVLVLWALFTSAYRVNEQEQGVVRRFGKVVRISGPGLRFKLPYPIEEVDLPKVKQINRLEIGFRTIDQGPPARYQDVPEESHMLTGDENIVKVEIIVQYKIKDAKKYLFNVRDVVNTLKDASESALREVIAMHTIDEALTTGKDIIRVETEQLIQKIMDSYDAGIEIRTVQLQDVLPPNSKVSDAFRDVASAREDKNRKINEAEGYENDIIPKARGKAEELINIARAYKSELVNEAIGDTKRYLSLLSEYKKAKRVTKDRLILETYEEILPEIKKFIIDVDKGNSILNLLPLEGGMQK